MNSTHPFRTDVVLKGACLFFAGVALLLPVQAISIERAKTAVPALARALQVANFGSEAAAPPVRQMADWVMASGNHAGMHFVIVDKQLAKVFVFHPDGKLSGASPALMGSARGDDSVPGIGERQMAAILPHERTTPAGRFESSPGVNMSGEDIVWVDYDAAVSMHRVRANNKKERRLERLASATPADNRISFGCINLPATFYDSVLKPALGTDPGVVYVLPETRSLQSVFGTLIPAFRPK
jgi:hypothetical protein